MGNDYGYEYVFFRLLEFLTREGELLVAINSSSESANIVNVVKAAGEKDMSIISFTGFRADKKKTYVNLYGLIQLYVLLKE